MKNCILWPLLLLIGLLSAQRQNNSSGPNAPIPKSEVLKLTGDLKDAKLEKGVKILWLYGPEDTPLSPLCSGPKAASRHSRQKQIPSSPCLLPLVTPILPPPLRSKGGFKALPPKANS